MRADTARVLAVTGTDTGVGKTLIACGLLLAARIAGVRAAGYKPVASGCSRTEEGLRNDDALALLAASAPGLAYAQVNPVALAPPIAPHLAAVRAGVSIDMDRLDAGLDALCSAHAMVVLEGAGGWRVPLSGVPPAGEDFAAWMQRRRVPTLLVVGLRLGAINHALLSAEAMQRAGCWAGWVANYLPEDDTGTAADMAATLEAALGPPLWSVPVGAQAPAVAQCIPESLLRQ